MSRKKDKQQPQPAASAAQAPAAKTTAPPQAPVAVQQVPVCTGCEQPLSQVKEYPGRPYTCVNRKCWKLGLLTLPVAVRQFQAQAPKQPTPTASPAAPVPKASVAPLDGTTPYCESCGCTGHPLKDGICAACYIKAMNTVGEKTGTGPQPFIRREDCHHSPQWPDKCQTLKCLTHDGCPTPCQHFFPRRKSKRRGGNA